MAALPRFASSQDEAALEGLGLLDSEPPAAGNAPLPLQAAPEDGALTKHRRLRGKQPVPQPCPWLDALVVMVSPAEVALAAACEMLPDDVRRQHIHWVHVRTKCARDRQPESFTRKGFWLHMRQVYLDVYPSEAEEARLTLSILGFGLVAKEKHAAVSQLSLHRFEHHHTPTFCFKRHMWKPVADRSYQHYGVKLHAACHDGYFTMYNYVTTPTAKKPLSELDSQIYFSPGHPRGEDLRKLLLKGESAARALQKRKRPASVAGTVVAAAAGDGESDGKRFRPGDLFDLVAESGVRTQLELQSMAEERRQSGDVRLAHFITSAGESRLEEMLKSAIAVLDAPMVLALKSSTRMELLRRAAIDSPCTCEGVWMPGALRVLANNAEDVGAFCRDVCRALEHGAARGVNMALLGAPGSGKSMLFESFDEIYTVMGKPQLKSTFPLAGVLEAQVLLWHEYKHNDGTVLFEDLLALLVGERLEIRVPHRANQSHRNKSPMFFTSNSLCTICRADPVETAYLNKAMQERFQTRYWQTPLPEAERVLSFPRCGRCCASFYLMHR